MRTQAKTMTALFVEIENKNDLRENGKKGKENKVKRFFSFALDNERNSKY